MMRKSHLNIKLPIRYLPKSLSARDRKAELRMLLRSKSEYKKHRYYTRKKVASYPHRPSKHLYNARNIYGVENMAPNAELSRATGCSIDALKQIVKKGEGAYYSSGSRPNQTPQSWGYARLASSITAGKSAAVDYNILERGCDHKKVAFRLAKKSRRKYKHGQSSAKRVSARVPTPYPR
jgi:hypothetical protein